MLQTPSQYSFVFFLFSAKLLENLMAYAKMFSQNIGHQFTKHTIRVTAMSGAAATEINGQTTASAFALMRSTDYATTEDIIQHEDTRMNIVDEISFAAYGTTLGKLSGNLQRFTECTEYQYGKHAIIFLGDFCQIASVEGDPIYEHEHGLFWEQALNCMVELQGTHRYNKCEVMRRINPVMREHGLSDEDRKILNTRVIDGDAIKMPDPTTTRFATFSNSKRCEINAVVFKNYLQVHHANCTKDNIPKTAIVIKAGTRWAKSKALLSFDKRKILFEECSEADCCDSRNKHCDPLLCLFYNSNVMGTANDDVLNGQANGTTALFKRAFLMPDANLVPIQIHGYWVYSVDIQDVESLELEWQDSVFKGCFRVESKNQIFAVKYPVLELDRVMRVKARIDFEYFPIVINHATTGHKLQGKSLEKLVIAQWSKIKNWAYVVISRVKTLEGLFLTEPIPEDIDFAPAPKYLEMMDRLRGTILAIPDQVQELMSTFQYP